MHHVTDANLCARIAGALPFLDRRRLPDVVDALFDQNAYKRRGEDFCPWTSLRAVCAP
jgi:hypothetical protein